jgi:hypothetical protein
MPLSMTNARRYPQGVHSGTRKAWTAIYQRSVRAHDRLGPTRWWKMQCKLCLDARLGIGVRHGSGTQRVFYFYAALCHERLQMSKLQTFLYSIARKLPKLAHRGGHILFCARHNDVSGANVLLCWGLWKMLWVIGTTYSPPVCTFRTLARCCNKLNQGRVSRLSPLNDGAMFGVLLSLSMSTISR